MSSIATQKPTEHANGHKVAPAKISEAIRKISNKSHEVPVATYEDNNDGGDDVVVSDGDGGDVPELSNEDVGEIFSDDSMEVDDDTNGKKLKRVRDVVDDDVHSDGGSTITTASIKGTPTKKKQKVEGGGGGTRSKKQKKVTDPRPSYFAKLFGFYHLIAAAVFAVIKPLTEVEEKTRTEPDSMLSLAVKYLAKTLSKEETGTIEAWTLGDDIDRFSELDFRALELADIDVKAACINWSAIANAKNYMAYTMKVAETGDAGALQAFCKIKKRVEKLAGQLAKAKDHSKPLQLGDYFYKPRSKNKAAEAEMNNQLLSWLENADTSKLFNPNPGKNIRTDSIGHSVLTTTANMYDTPIGLMDSLPILTGNTEALRDLLNTISMEKAKHKDGFILRVCEKSREASVGLINACETIFNGICDREKQEHFMQLVSDHTRLKYESRYEKTQCTTKLVVKDANGNLKLPDRPAKTEGKRGSSPHICKPMENPLIKPDVLEKLEDLRHRMLDVQPSAQLVYLDKLWKFMQHFKLSCPQLTDNTQKLLQDVITAMQTCAAAGKQSI